MTHTMVMKHVNKLIQHLSKSIFYKIQKQQTRHL